MSRESILKVQETEEKAARLVEAARARAHEMTEAAERDGKALCAETEKRVREEYRAMFLELRARCDRLAEKNQAEITEELAALRREVNLRRKIAEKIIVRGLESKCR